MGGDQRLELRHELCVTSQLKLGPDPVLLRGELQFDEVRDRLLGELVVLEVGKGGSAPQAERLLEPLLRFDGFA
jgi:hypothetical protein